MDHAARGLDNLMIDRAEFHLADGPVPALVRRLFDEIFDKFVSSGERTGIPVL